MALNSQCADDPNRIAEQFCLGKLSPDANEAFAVHIQGCESCLQVYQEWKDWIESARTAMKKTRGSDGTSE